MKKINNYQNEFEKGELIITKSKKWLDKYGINNEKNKNKIILNVKNYNPKETIMGLTNDIINEFGLISVSGSVPLVNFDFEYWVISGILLNKVDENLSSLIENYCNSFCNKSSCDTDCPLNNFYESIDYRVGDKVQIISINVVSDYFSKIDDYYFMELGVNLNGNIILSKIVMNSDMMKYCYKEVTISGIIKDPRQQEDDLYLIKEDGEENRWSDIMFKRLYEKTAIIRYCNQCIKCCDNSCPFYNIKFPDNIRKAHVSTPFHNP